MRPTRPPGHARTTIAALLLAAALTAPVALAETQIEVTGGDKVTGSLDPAAERETLLAEVPGGALLSVVVKGKKPKGGTAPAPGIEVYLADGPDLAAGLVRGTKKGAKLKKLPLTQSGVYRIVVVGDGTNAGDYQAKVTWKTPSRAAEVLALAAGEASLAFVADAGALANLKAKPSKGSAAVPEFLRLEHPATGTTVALQQAGKAVSLKKQPLAHSGDWQLVLRSSAEGGDAKVTLKVRAPKAPKRKLIVTDEALLAVPGSGVDALVRVIGRAGGAITADDLGLTPIAGAALEVPAGSLPIATPIVLAGSTPIEPSDLVPDLEGVGPTLFFGPAGTLFEPPANVTLPFEPGGFAGDFTTLRIVKRNADGTETLVPPGSYELEDAENGRVSFPTSSFSSFRTFGTAAASSPAVPGDINGDGFGDVIVPTQRAGTNFTTLSVFFGRTSFGAVEPNESADADLTFVLTSDAVVFTTGDMNGDGIHDLVIGDPLADQIAGEVYIFFGGPGITSSADVPTDADLTIRRGNFFGRHLLMADLVGGPEEELVVVADEGGLGRIYVYATGPDITQSLQIHVQITGAQSEGLGRNIAAGDVDADGAIDLVASTNSDVHVFFGGPDFATTFDRTSAEADVTITPEPGEFAVDGAGLGVADVTGDGTDDLVALNRQFNSFAGRVHVFPGRAGFDPQRADFAPIQITGDADNRITRMGLGNLNDDGGVDLILASLTPIVSLPDELLIHLGGGGLQTSLSTAAEGRVEEAVGGDGLADTFSDVPLRFQDANADGRPDLVVRAASAGSIGMFDGAAYVIFARNFAVTAPPTNIDDADAVIRGAEDEQFGR